jgi:hypothetical protein
MMRRVSDRGDRARLHRYMHLVEQSASAVSRSGPAACVVVLLPMFWLEQRDAEVGMHADAVRS